MTKKNLSVIAGLAMAALVATFALRPFAAFAQTTTQPVPTPTATTTNDPGWSMNGNGYSYYGNSGNDDLLRLLFLSNLSRNGSLFGGGLFGGGLFGGGLFGNGNNLANLLLLQELLRR